MAFLKKKGFKFNVDLELLKLSDVPLVNAVLFAKVRLLEGGTFEGQTERVLLLNHAACWNARFNFSCRIPSDPVTGVLERCACRISLRREQKGGRSYQKIGFVDVNLSQFAASGVDGVVQSLLLDAYGANQRQDNSRIVLKITMSHQSADPIFKVPRKESCVEEEFLNPAERRAPSGDISNSFPNPSCVDASHSRSSSFDDSTTDGGCNTLPSHQSNFSSVVDSFNIEKCGYMSLSTPNVHSIDGIRRSALTGTIPLSRRYSQDRSQLNKCCEDGITLTRIRATRVDAENIIDQMLAETVIPSIENHEDNPSDQGLELFVSKNGEAVISGRALRSRGSFERVHIADAGIS